MKAFVLCAGSGSRLAPLTVNRAKPMLPVLNKPVLEHILAWLMSEGIDEFIINLYHKPESVKDYFKNLRQYNITYSEEPRLLGTAGAVKKCQSLLPETFLVVYGDNIFKTDLGDLFKFHKSKKSQCTLGLIETEDVYQSGIALLDEYRKVVRFKEKPREEEVFSNLTNAGIILVEPEILDYIPENVGYDFGKDFFPQLTFTKRGGNFYGFKLKGVLEDIGTPQRYLNVNLSLLEGKSLVAEGCKIKDANISKSVIGSGCIIDNGVKVKESVLDKRIKIGKDTKIENSIILEGTVIGEGVTIKDAVIADKCSIAKGASVGNGAGLWPGVKVRGEKEVFENIEN